MLASLKGLFPMDEYTCGPSCNSLIRSSEGGLSEVEQIQNITNVAKEKKNSIRKIPATPNVMYCRNTKTHT